MAELIDKKYLAGLTFRSSKQVKTPDGKKVVPTERALQPADVLDWKDNGPTLTIVTGDGKKHTVSKAAIAKA